MWTSKLAARPGVLLAGLVALASCAPTPRPPLAPPAPEAPPPPPANALAAGVTAGPSIDALGLTAAAAETALAAFRISCPPLLKRVDVSGLTRAEDWSEPCAAAATWPASDALGFFTSRFATATVGTGQAFATGYFEPEIAGSREPRPGYEVPVYRVPPDLVRVVPEGAPDSKPKIGRFENGKLELYYDRGQIDDGALAGQGLEIAWAADTIEFFFLQIQGSGRLRLPDGGVMRIGYAGQNGREYVAIGKLLKERGVLGPGQTSMQGIVAWLRAHPEEGRAVMRENKSYVFFRELTGPGPLGALDVPVTARASIAADPQFVPLGAPVFLAADKPVASGLWVAQDTGGAIKGANRFDTFWGAGPEARTIAGGMQAEGRAYLLLPKPAVARLGGR